ncbi:MAG: thiamine phosphate synthase [Bacteroidales bacterium]|nr:thiamine phosphate synthase [Bacteroidales bacterium]
MRIIAITSPKAVENEAAIIKRLLAERADFVHIRKPLSEFFPDADSDLCDRYYIVEYISTILEKLTAEERNRIIIHDYYELYEEFSLKGCHINKNIERLPAGYKGFRTRSCHSLEEIEKYKKEFDYLFLSPIFDSISKPGYKSAFSKDLLLKAAEKGIIDEKVVALGGVTPDKIPFLEELNFGGAAMVGALWTI